MNDCMQPGGAGVPFYVGNARCSRCGGHGFSPCPLCVGYVLRMPSPDPVAGPEPMEGSDVLINSISWLKQFPDSRICTKAQRSRRGEVTAKHTDPAQPARDKRTSDSVNYSVLAYNFYARHAHLKQRK
jgi:hypothetical protein